MKRIRLTKEFCFEMAHALKHHDGPCKHIHGHSYKLAVTVLGSPSTDRHSPKQGMVMDFSDLKKIVQEQIVSGLDHSLVLNLEDFPDGFAGKDPIFDKIVPVTYQPTCENLLLDFSARLREHLPERVKLVHLFLRETPTSYSEWFASDNESPLPL